MSAGGNEKSSRATLQRRGRCGLQVSLCRRLTARKARSAYLRVRDYDRLTEGIALLKILARGEKSIQEGRGVPAEDAFARIRATLEEAKANG
ncbi:hypothetical protein [Nitratidesulfovibrio sp. 1201_IL3209]|uniref:hypothetical protein n=1 Tax=Nitratidesulfovibrio sp. 1201_IL3209 TaxID=3084053 RepID=UPI002FDA55FD